MSFKKKFTIIVVIGCIDLGLFMIVGFIDAYYSGHTELLNSERIGDILTITLVVLFAILCFLIYLPFKIAKNHPEERELTYGKLKKPDMSTSVSEGYIKLLSGIDNIFDKIEVLDIKIEIITKRVQLRLDCYVFVECEDYSADVLKTVTDTTRSNLLEYYGEEAKKQFLCVTIFIEAKRQNKEFMKLFKEGLGFEYREYYFIAGTTPGSLYMYHTQCDFGPAQAMHNKMKKRFYKVLGVKKKKKQE